MKRRRRRCFLRPEYDLLLGFFSLNPHLSLPDAELIEAVRAAAKPAVACFLSSFEAFAAYDRSRLEQAGIPCFATRRTRRTRWRH